MDLIMKMNASTSATKINYAENISELYNQKDLSLLETLLDLKLFTTSNPKHSLCQNSYG